MSYQVFAQKYRPQGFDDIIGQEVIARTLKNSVTRGRVANAYIFCGPRGVGKTSVARIVSKTLNCEEAPEKSPCNRCVSCEEITKGNNMDVLEIDGASNRGIDEIRALRENVKFSPSRGEFKIYIIDEVHMLTPEAFNALLKTLEEPPGHVKFIFATTEAHKVLPTIMSRCQRFDFKRIPPGLIFDRVMMIAKKENIDIDEKAALLIARSADGSLRDALVILDQMVSFSEKKISTDDVIELLGMVHKDRIFDLSDAVILNDTRRVMGVLDELINGGKDPVFIVNSLMGHYRDLMILKTAGAPTSDMAFSEDELVRMKKQQEKLSLEEILYILQTLSHCLTLMKNTMFTRAPLEISLIRLARKHNVLSLPEILGRLEKLGNMQGNTRGAVDGRENSAGAVPEEPDVPASSNIESNSDTERTHWKAVLNYVKNRKMSVFTSLSDGKLMEFDNDRVIIGFGQDDTFNKDVLESDSSMRLIDEAVASVLGASPKLEFKLLEFLGKSARDAAETEKKKAMDKEALKPVLEKAMDIFGGHVVRDFTERTR